MDQLGRPPDEEVLVLRVVSAARRRRNRRLVVLAALVVAAVLAVALPLALATGEHPPTGGTAGRASIYALARAHYPAADAPSGRGHGHLVFGELKVTGDHASLPVDLLCGPLCGHGDVLLFTRVRGVWTLTGARPAWVDLLSRRPAS